MLKRYCYFFFVLSLFNICVLAQDPGKRCKWISTFNHPVLLDSLSADVESIAIPADSTLNFQYDYSQGTITIFASKYDSVRVCYQVFPFAFHQSYAHHTLQEYDSGALFKTQRTTDSWIDQREEMFATDQLYKSGSISRGVSFGNNQDVFVNSNLNLQMEGKLTSDVNISAVITDQNIPFQPEGNTQQLQDFDKVLINLYNDKFRLSAGDVVLQHQGNKKGESYFLQYYKNVQGGRLETNYSMLKGKAKTSLGVSIAKGKFASIQIEPLEGVQGPYRVRGPNDERFVVILAGSEKVFVDGLLLIRGYNNDYVVDYNLGEITFTNKVLITKYTRIRVDFEFSDQNYSKAILAAAHEQQWRKTRVFVNAYSEKDNKNRPLTYQITNDDREDLSKIGDNLGNAAISGIDSVGFSQNRIRYKMIDTVDASGRLQSILVFSTNPDSAVYQARFSQIGQGRGNYLQSNSTLNGIVFEWVGVNENGIPQGEFEPEVQVTTPQQKQLLTVGIVHDLSPVDYVYAETAFSGSDLNLYSELDDNDNNGRALKLGFVRNGKAIFRDYLLSSRFDYEHTSKFFKPIDRFRYIEFDRDWSLTREDLAVAESDHILSAEIEVKKDTDNLVRYKIVKRKRDRTVDGYQHQLQMAKNLGNFQLRSDLYRMSSDKFESHSNWFRWTLDAFYRHKWLVPGYRYQIDRNEISAIRNDSIIGSAMNYSAHNFYLRNADSTKTRFLVDYSIREDRLPNQGDMVPADMSQTLKLGLGTELGKNQGIDLLFTYRNLENLQPTDGPGYEEHFTARLDWQGDFFDKHVVSELNYQAGNSRELKRDFIFIEVPTGEGTHTWRDENQDGVQDLNEFYLALNPDERNYAKIFVPTDEYILAFANTFNYRLNLELPRHWREASGLKALLGRISSQTTLNIQRKLTDDRLNQRFSPFAKNIADEDLIASKDQFRTTWFFNRSHAKYGFDFGKLMLKNKQLLMDGFEASEIKGNHVNFRYNPQKAILLRLFSSQSTKEVASDFLESRNYIIREHTVTPEIAWQPGDRFRISGKYSMISRKNVFIEGNGESASVKEFSIDLRHSKVRKSTLNANVTFTNIQFVGEVNTAVGYELLQALQPGDNLLWSANWQLRIAAGLQLSLNYHGRKSPGMAVIHTGRMQVNALF